MISANKLKPVLTVKLSKIFQKNQFLSFSTAPISAVIVPGMLNLYGNPRSQPTRSVLMLLRDAKIKHAFHQLNNRDGEHRKPEYKKALPAGLLPSIVTADGVALGEGAAILQYLVDQYDIKDWTSTDIITKAQINFWLHWNHTNTRNGTMKILVPEILYPPKTDVEATLAKGQKAHVRNCKFITNHLVESGNKFLATASTPTIADLMIVTELDQLSAKGYRLFDYTPFPRIEQYIADVRSAVRSYDETFQPVVEKGEELAALKKTLKNEVN